MSRFNRVVKLSEISYARGVLSTALNLLSELEGKADSQMFDSTLQKIDTKEISKRAYQALLSVNIAMRVMQTNRISKVGRG